MKLKSIYYFILLFFLFSQIITKYPEDFSSIEQLAYTKASSDKEEVYIGSYFYDTVDLSYNDKRNGIKLYSTTLSSSTISTCPTTINSYNENDDTPWDFDSYDNIYYPPTYTLLDNNKCIIDNSIIFDLSSFINDDDNEKYEAYIFYFWIETENDNDYITFSCSDAAGNNINFLSSSSSKGLYQFYLKYEFSNTFSANDVSFSCTTKSIKIQSSSSAYNIIFHRMKLTALISKEKVSEINCADNSDLCPFSYYCDNNSTECKKCLGMYSECKDRKTGLSCSRFSAEWENVGTEQEDCTAEYYNLQKIDEISFDIIPPIISNAASISFWLFTTSDINEPSNTDQINPNIYHITLEDFFVITIIPGKSKYIIYVTGYEMYHEAYGTILKDLKTKTKFEEALNNNSLPYENWFISKNIEKINRWVNVIVSYNKNLRRISLQFFYKKRDALNSGSLDIDGNIATETLDEEYIYGNKINNEIKSILRFNKYYRNSDSIQLNFKIYNNDIGVYFRKLYVFATELLIVGNTDKLLGFQYLEFEKLFNVENSAIPELILAVPFDNITKSNSEENKYFIEYFLYDMTKIRNNRLKKYLILNKENIEESLYTYFPGLYRLNLISKKNKMFENELLLTLEDITCTDANAEYCYYNPNTDKLAFSCKYNYLIKPGDRTCDTSDGSRILVAGINKQSNRGGTFTDVCYNDGCTSGSLTEFTCSTKKIFDACINLNDDFIGYFYYSYFFKLPPIKFNLDKLYESYYIQFNFLYETNSFLRPKDKLRGKKLYLFYSDAFRIWHDYSMNYLGVEDKLGNSYKNLIPNFNTENENLFTISVIKEDNIYKGKIFLNGVKIHMPPFTAGSLSYILFCHNDSACPVGNNVFWTSGFYNQIKIYDLTDIEILNDNSFYDLYIYNNYYSYNNYAQGEQRFNSYPTSEEINMEIKDMAYNYISGKTISNTDANKDKLPMFNYGISQTFPLRKVNTNYENINYVDENFITTNTCPNSISCYGGSNIFSKEVRTCENTKYFKYDTCQSFPTSPKNKYYSLTLPFYGNPSEKLSYNLNGQLNMDTPSNIKARKVTYSFWIKLIGFKESRIFLIDEDTNSNYCFLLYEKFNKLAFICGDINDPYYYNSYEIPQKNFGKYMHISIALSMHEYSSKKRFFISFQIDKVNINNVEKDILDNYDFIDIQIFYLYLQIYAQISKFYIYNEVLIGGYAFNTNNYFELTPIKIVDDSQENCFLPDPSHKCISDYDPVLNDDYYIDSGYPSKKNVFLTQNNMYKIKECSDKCGSSCYNTDEKQCACATNSYYDYIFKNDNSYLCKKLPYLDFKRYTSLTFTLVENGPYKGIDFWFYATGGVNTYSTTDLLYKINKGTNDIIISIGFYTIINEICDNDDYLYCTDDTFLEHWCHIYCEFNEIITELIFENSESTLTSPGIMLIRQFKLWKDFPPDKEELFFTAFIDSLERTEIFLSIDSLINSEKIINFLPTNRAGLILEPLSNADYFGYSPVENEIPELELCQEIEECKDIINLVGIKDINFTSITHSGTSRYTIELWIKIKNLSRFLKGINIIWLGHISLSALTDTLNDKLALYCFPREFLSSPYGVSGRNIIDITAKNSINKDLINLELNQYENTWFYMRCAYSWDNEIFYFETDKVQINDEPKNVEKENANYYKEVDYPYKYLFTKYQSYNVSIQNAYLNDECEVYIRNLYLYNEYLPKAYNTQKVLFNKDNTVKWITLGVDFFNFKEISSNNINITFFKKDNHEYKENDVTVGIIDGRKYKSKGGMLLKKAIKDSSDTSDTKEKIKKEDNQPLECKENFYLSFESTATTCDLICPNGYNRAPGAILDLDETVSGMCNYILDWLHLYQNTTDFDNKMVCSSDSYVRVGFKCFPVSSQVNSAIYFNRCYNFYPIYKTFGTIQQNLTSGYILEISFKVDLVNEFCSKEGIDERYFLWAEPHAIILDSNDKFYYKDTNKILERITSLPLSLYEWNHVIIEFRPKDLVINIYVNYNMAQPCFIYQISNEDISKYNLNNVAFCTGTTSDLCSLITISEIHWGAAYYSKFVIYSLKYSSVYTVYENMLNKFNYDLNSIVLQYIFNSIGNDLNVFYDDYGDLDLFFNDNLPLVSSYRASDNISLYSSSSNFDYGEFHPNVYVTEVEAKTGAATYDNCYSGCKRCYSSEKNDCYQCDEGFELFNKQCRRMTGYYYQLNNYDNQELEVQIDSDSLNYNNITITLWVKYYGLIRNSEYSYQFTSSTINCPMLIKFSTDDNVYLCHEQKENNLLMYRGEISLFNDTRFLENLGTWQLISVSNYKCSFSNINSCNYYPSIFSLAINGQTVSKLSSFDIPIGGITLNKILFGYGIIMILGDINIYNAFILNPYGIVTNYNSYKRYLINSLQFYSSTESECIKTQMILSLNGRDMFYQQTGHCIKDYNLYHNLENFICESEDQMININSVNNECFDCISQCEHCGGESKLNCACYSNDTYWFRNDKDTNRLYCELVPYLDLNKYSQLEFKEIQYATTNEYAIEFWYFIYEYNEEEIHFYDQTISWENHVKIEFTKYTNKEVKIECFPLNEKDESISDNDVTQKFFEWNHVICATDLNNKLYYLNDRKVNNIIGEGVKQMNYSTYDDRKVTLNFESLNNMGDTSSNGVFLIKELKLWNFFAVREFDTKCIYNYEWSKNNEIPNILHYFPFKMDKKGIIEDIKGNEPSQKILKNKILGYNVIDYSNKYSIDEEFEECLIIYALPQRIYFNLTNVLIYNYEINPKPYGFYNYKYEYYLSKNAEVPYINITKNELKVSDNPRELLLKKFKESHYKDTQLNIYITLTEAEDDSKTYYGFTMIKINTYYPGLDLNYTTNGMQDNLNIDLENLINKYDFSEKEIWNRLNLYSSLGDIHSMALNDENTTTTFLNYRYDQNSLSYYANNIIIKNPICNDNYCSGKGKCVIIVRNMICKCDEGYTGSNCQLTLSNKEYISETNLKMWNYLTNINEFSTLDINTKLLEQITFLVKSSSIFDDSYNILTQNFFNFVDFLKTNYFELLLEKINLIFDTISYILINMYHNIQQFRAENYFSSGNPKYSSNAKIPEVDLTLDQIDLIYDLSFKITTIIPELILYLVKVNQKDTVQNYTAFDFTIQSVSHSFDYLEYFENLHINDREKYNTYLPYINAYKCSDYIFGSTGYTTLFLVLLNYHYDPLSYHPQYSSSASYSMDIFYATQIGEKLDIKACPNLIDIYFPLTLYNQSEIDFINSHTQFLGENEENKNYDVNDPYVTWPVYVNKDGSILKKSRYDRINEVLPMIHLECSYYNNKLGLSSNISSTLVSDNFYLVCQTHHLSFYTIQSISSKYEYKKAGKFFYLGAPRVFICGSNWGNGCSILLIIIFFIFAGFIILFGFLEKTLMITKSSLNNIKLEILKQNRLIIDEVELVEEITKVNKMNEQDNMEKNLNIYQEHDKVDKDLKQNLYLYGTKNIDYNETAFEGGDKGKNLEDYAGKGVFSNPPKKQKSKSKKKDKHVVNNGFIIDDLYEINDLDDKEDEKSDKEKETNIKKSIDYINKRKAKRKIKPKPKTEDNDSENEKKNNNLRYYNVKEYNPEKANQIDKYNYNLYKDSDFGFNESEGTEEKKQNNNIRLNSDINSLKDSTDELKSKDGLKNKKEDEKKGEHDNNINSNMHDNDDSDGVDNVDYFSKYKSVIKNENRKGGKKVIVQNGNYTIVDKYRKVTFVKEKIHYINLPDFFEQINKKDPNLFFFFLNLFLRRDIYISPFMVSSTINPRWKRILSLYMYILLQFLFLTFEMTLGEDTNITKGVKVFFFQLINIFISDLVMLALIPFYRISTKDKRTLFLNLKSTQQMQLLKTFKEVKDTQKNKMKYIIAIMVSTFIVTFYLSFNYCVVLYDSRWTFAGCFLVGVVFDCFLYEGLLNGVVILFYYLKKKNKIFDTPYKYLFNLRNYRNCF